MTDGEPKGDALDWMNEAPRATAFIVAPVIMSYDGHDYPTLSMAFRSPTGETVTTVTLFGTPTSLRSFAKQVVEATKAAETVARQTQRGRARLVSIDGQELSSDH